MGWNPFDIDQYADPRRNAWVRSHQIRMVKKGIPKQTVEVWWIMAPPFVCLVIAFGLMRATSDLKDFWLAERGWLAVLQGAAIVSALTMIALLVRLATKRYASSVTEEGMPPVPGWFRFLLASLELGQVAAALAAVLALGLDLVGTWFEAALVCLVAAYACAISHFLVRWKGESVGWVAGRLFWGRFD